MRASCEGGEGGLPPATPAAGGVPLAAGPRVAPPHPKPRATFAMACDNRSSQRHSGLPLRPAGAGFSRSGRGAPPFRRVEKEAKDAFRPRSRTARLGSLAVRQSAAGSPVRSRRPLPRHSLGRGSVYKAAACPCTLLHAIGRFAQTAKTRVAARVSSGLHRPLKRDAPPSGRQAFSPGQREAVGRGRPAFSPSQREAVGRGRGRAFPAGSDPCTLLHVMRMLHSPLKRGVPARTQSLHKPPKRDAPPGGRQAVSPNRREAVGRPFSL